MCHYLGYHPQALCTAAITKRTTAGVILVSVVLINLLSGIKQVVMVIKLCQTTSFSIK